MVTPTTEDGGGGKMAEEQPKGGGSNLQVSSLVALLLAALRRSMMSSCRLDRRRDGDDVAVAVTLRPMEIGWPTDVKHVAHVTFDRFNGFLGLPIEFELEVPTKAPSASARVFGVSAESMQCSYDSKGNSVPTILLLMQEHLYMAGGLKTEGIFRINPENSEEEHVREQLNKGTVPDDIDVHCLAGLIKAWFRELPEGVLDGLSPDQVLESKTEEDFVELVKLLGPTQAALLNWAVELMADVVEEEEMNKMNARNIAMVFAPNMTQMSDPLTALMHAVQVMNFLKTLILRTLRERQEVAMTGYSTLTSSPDHQAEDGSCNSEQDTGSSYDEREYTSDEDQADYSHTSGDEVESLNDIEECFLRQLDQEHHTDDDACEDLVVYGGHVSPKTPNRSFRKQAQAENTGSGSSGFSFNTESALSVSNKQSPSFSTSEDEAEDDFSTNPITSGNVEKMNCAEEKKAKETNEPCVTPSTESLPTPNQCAG
ncbi:Rho GTPase-activating protein 2 [Nymphaea thermarum]|nr:Rho GTPase-activating protein 2 [Nymphaea thermarum]